jgi:ATP-dependent Clp protease adaptor protein ClpS
MAKRNISTVERTEEDTLTLEKEDIREPNHYTVILHNDDFTTQDFVVHVLMSFFHKNQDEAHQLMLKVHLEGKARVGSYIKDIAETKVALITSYSRENGMPLLVTAERE